MRSLPWLLSLFLLPPAVHVAQGAEIRFAALPGNNLAYKQVLSIRERRFKDLVEQKTDFSCGAAALATILNKAYGWNLQEAEVIRGMLANADPNLVLTQGFSMLDMKNYADKLGLRARGYRIEQDKLENLKVPSIVLHDVRGYKHFVVLQRTFKGYVYLGDPVLGHKKMPLEEFAKGWNGIVFALIGPGYDRYNALLTPPEPLTARQRINSFSPVKDAELMEFGFIQSDFF
ncbi:C39 family peptidase [Pseudomonas sp. 5P_3.1_Bac2]|uniref:C39 family peptidase n=1 Tax=Pseudomonas sp. 5P_3.1_Bac2 TaxID=2971617 RepID=UPI0021C980A1|nr:C39 family peptidase [Pseudomonas sp. 5P_3.1_Bac2]MCU1718557.1 C39 family peptidase [Pseudomonas sp. 5P_3.1_Bac2]